MTKEIPVRVLYVVGLSLALLILVSPFIIPIFFAATVSLTLAPVLKYLLKMGLKRKAAAALLTTIFSVVISIPVTFFVVKGTVAVTDQLEKLFLNDRIRTEGVSKIVSSMRHDLITSIQTFSAKHAFLKFLDEDKINQYLGLANTYLLNFFKSFLASLPSLFVLLLIMILCTYSFLNNAHSVRKMFQKLFGFSDNKMDQLVLMFQGASRQVYFSNIATGSIQSLIVAAAVSLLGFAEFFLVFFVTLILSFIPVIGAAPVAFLTAIIAFFMGNTSAAVILVVVGVFAGVIDNILRPWLASFGQSKIPPIVAFVCVIGGAILLGFPGLFIGLLFGCIGFETLPFFWNELETRKHLPREISEENASEFGPPVESDSDEKKHH